MPDHSKPILCYVTDRQAFPPPAEAQAGAVVGTIRRAAAAGIDWVQVREKDLATRPLLELVRQAVAAARATATRILVNDRLDLAVVSGAAGVHLGGESVRVAEVRRWREGRFDPSAFAIGASCHSLREAQAAERDGADYLFFGPVYATPAKRPYGPPQGVEGLAEVCRRVRIPVIAIGGITAENAPECIRAGAAGMAAIRLFQQAGDLGSLVGELRSAF